MGPRCVRLKALTGDSDVEGRGRASPPMDQPPLRSPEGWFPPWALASLGSRQRPWSLSSLSATAAAGTVRGLPSPSSAPAPCLLLTRCLPCAAAELFRDRVCF